MLMNLCCRVARRGVTVSLRASHLRITPSCSRYFSTTLPRSAAAVPAEASAAAACAETAANPGNASTLTSSAVPQTPVAASDAPTAIGKLSSEELDLSSLAQEILPDPSSTATLQELGLGGWSPSGMVQTLLDGVHGFGLPWWATIAVCTLTFKVVLFPLTVITQRHMISLNNNMPHFQKLQAKHADAQESGDTVESLRAANELGTFMKKNNVSPIKGFYNMMIQGPIFISFYLALRGMANLPLESMKTGGLAWFTDLTIPDPYYVFPALTSVTLYATIKMGAEGGMRPEGLGLSRYFLYGMPFVAGCFTAFCPAAVVCYWTTSNIFTLTQVAFLRIPAVRSRLNMPKLIRHDKSQLLSQKKGFWESVQDKFQGLKRQRNLRAYISEGEARFRKAGMGPIVKTFKYDPTKTPQAVQAKKR